MANAVLEIENDRIVSVRKHDPSQPDTNGWLDLGDHTVMPCMVDCHVHLAFPRPGREQRAVFETIGARLDRYRQNGVIAVRDGGDPRGWTRAYKTASISKGVTAPQIRASAGAWHRADRYGGLVGTPVSGGRNLLETIEKSPGSDHVKIINSGLNSLVHFGKETPPQFTVEALRNAFEKARGLDLKCMVHANGVEPVKSAVLAGCDSVEHGFFMGSDNLARMAEAGTFWVPTAVAMKALAGRFDKDSIEACTAARTLEHQLEQIGIAHAEGVRIATGSDAGLPGVDHGKGVFEELKLLLAAGIPVAKAVQCATDFGARLLGIEDIAGRLVPGMPAAMIAVKGGPAEGLRHWKKKRLITHIH